MFMKLVDQLMMTLKKRFQWQCFLVLVIIDFRDGNDNDDNDNDNNDNDNDDDNLNDEIPRKTWASTSIGRQ